MYTILTTLIQSVGFTLKDIEHFFVAGAFGNRINPRRGPNCSQPAPARNAMSPWAIPAFKGAADVLLVVFAKKWNIKTNRRQNHLPGNERQPGFYESLQRRPLIPHTDTSLFHQISKRILLI